MAVRPEDIMATRPQVPEGVTAATGGYTDPQQIMTVPPVVPPLGQSPTKLSYEPKPGWQKGYVSMLQDHLQQGMSGAAASVNGYGILIGVNTAANAKKQVETADYAQATQNIHDYANGDGYKQFLANIGGGWEAGQVPSLGAVGAGMGFGAGAALLLGTPPGWGIAFGGGAIMGALAAGHMMYDQHVNRGVDLNTSKVAALASGIGAYALGILGGKATATALGAASSAGVTTLAGRLVANMKVQIPATLVQNLQDSVIKFVSTNAAGVDRPYTLADGMRDMSEAAVQTFATAPINAAGTEVVGRLAGSATVNNFLSEERGSASPFSILPEEAVKALQDKLDEMVAAKKQERDARILGEVVKKQKLNEDQAHFEEKFNAMDASGLDFMMQLGLSPEMHARTYQRWLKLTGNVEQSEALGSDAPGIPIDAAAANEEMGFGKPARQLTDRQKETAEKVKAVKKQLPPAAAAPNEEENQRLVDTALVYMRVLKGAAPKVLAAARNAQAEGREITPEEQAQLDRETMLSTKPDHNKERLQHQLESFLKKNLPWKPGAGMYDSAHRVKLGIAFQYAPPAAVHDLSLALDTLKAAQDSDAYALKLSEIVDAHMQGATGLNAYQLETAAWHASRTMVEINYTNAHGEPDSVHLTLAAVAKYYALMKNADALVGLTSKHGNAYTTGASGLEPHQVSTEEAFEQALASAQIPRTTGVMGSDLVGARKPLEGATYFNMIEGAQSAFDDLGDLLAEDYARLNPGKTLKLQPKGTYGGPVRREGMVEKTGHELQPAMPGDEYEYEQAHRARLTKENPSYTLQRAGLEKFIMPGDLFVELNQRVRSQANWAMVTEPAKLWDAFMGHPDTKNILDARLSGLYTSLKNGYVDAVSGRMEAQGRANKAIDGFMANISIQDLWGKPLQALNHWFTMQRGLMYSYKGKMIPAKMFGDSIWKFWTDGGAARAEMSQWDAARVRYAHKSRIGANVSPDSLTPRTRRIQNAGMAPFPFGDAKAYYAIMAAVRDFVRSEGGGEETANTEAVQAVESLLASSSVAKVSDLGRHPWGKSLKQFHQPEDAIASAVMEKARIAANFPTEENVKNLVRAQVVGSISAGLFALVPLLWKMAFDTKKKADDNAHEWVQKMKFAGLTYPASEIAHGVDSGVGNLGWNEKNQVFELDHPILHAINVLVGLPHDMQEIMSGEETAHHVVLMMTHVVQGLNRPIPKQPLEWLDHLTPKKPPENEQ